MLRPDCQAFVAAAKPMSCIRIRVLYAAEVPGGFGESTGTDIDHECSHHSMFYHQHLIHPWKGDGGGVAVPASWMRSMDWEWFKMSSSFQTYLEMGLGILSTPQCSRFTSEREYVRTSSEWD